jgi:hypothetical protein
VRSQSQQVGLKGRDHVADHEERIACHHPDARRRSRRSQVCKLILCLALKPLS